MEEIRAGFTRVTSVFEPYTDYDKIDPVTLSNACDRGNKVHAMAEMYAKGDWFPTPPNDLNGYIESFQGWFDTMVTSIVATEQRYYNDLFRITGAIDLVAILKNDTKPTIIDYKTSASVCKTWPLQLACYKFLYDESNPTRPCDRRLVIQLDKKGKPPKVHEYTQHKRDMGLYLGILNAHHWFYDEK